MTKKISIIIPCYNAEKYVSKCLDSLLEQTYQDFEVICVNDVSSDDTLSILQRYAEKDSRIHIIEEPENRGVSVARNDGLDAAKGEYILFCDPDDYYELDALEEFQKAMEKSQADAVCSEINVVYHAHHEMKVSDLNYYSLKQFGLHRPSTKILQKLDLSTNDKMFRRSLIEQYQLRFPQGLHFEDAYFTVAYICICERIYFLNKHLYNYVRHDNSTMSNTWSSDNSADYAIDHLHVAFRLYDFFSEYDLLAKYADLFWQLLYQFSWFAIHNSKTRARRKEAKRELKAFVTEHQSEFRELKDETKHKINSLINHRHLFSVSRIKIFLLKFMPLRRLQAENIARLRSAKLDVESMLESDNERNEE